MFPTLAPAKGGSSLEDPGGAPLSPLKCAIEQEADAIRSTCYGQRTWGPKPHSEGRIRDTVRTPQCKETLFRRRPRFYDNTARNS